MLRKIIIALMVLAVAVLPLTATCVLTADASQQTTSNTPAHLTVPLAGGFSGSYSSIPGQTTYVGTGFFTYCGWSRIKVTQSSAYLPPYYMTITTTKGTISLQVPYGSSTYQIEGGTGRFTGASGSGYFSLHQDAHGRFTGSLAGTVVLA